jgi:predicted metal-binding protein
MDINIIKISRLIVSNKTGQWCKIPYPNHLKGCPNYGKKDYCPPPSANLLINILDLKRPMYIVYSEFDLDKHILKMKNKHPQWTDRQLRNVLYWQGTSRKQLKERVRFALYKTGCNFVSYCP